jgi:hypothetical protein
MKVTKDTFKQIGETAGMLVGGVVMVGVFWALMIPAGIIAVGCELAALKTDDGPKK